MELTSREIVSELDKFIIGQDEAKKAVAIALRNRYRRSKLPIELRDEITPKNRLQISNNLRQEMIEIFSGTNIF